MEVVKIRLQAQQHSLADPMDLPKYRYVWRERFPSHVLCLLIERVDGGFDRNAAHAAYTIVKEEGLATLYRGVTLTALRQATNQGKFHPPKRSGRPRVQVD
jgi:solute carrier family 25 citrate transporter 1